MPHYLSPADAEQVRCLLRETGERLDSAVRVEFESRFGCTLSQVRTHTSEKAAAVAARLNSRAFCFGSHVVFGANEYQPHSESGLSLLAHELTHVVQQNGQAPDPANAPLLDGGLRDPLETEAESVAQSIASRRSLPAITQGVPPALRRVIIIKAPATTGIDVITTGVTAEAATEVGPGRDMVNFNLRRNFNSVDPPHSGTAFKFLGHVGVTFSPGDPVRDFTFGWVQFMRQIEVRITYAGRDDSEGQVVIDPLSLIGTNFLIDRDPAGAAFSPFARSPALTGFDATANEVTAPLDDHPMITVRDRVHNFTTGHANFIFSLVDHREAVSIFVVRDKFGIFTPLAHLSWDLFYSGTFKWRNRHILIASDVSSFTPKPFAKGAPTDRRITALMSKLSPSIAPMFNPTSQNALRNAAIPPPPNNANRIETDHYTVNVPALFFLEGRGSEDIP